MKESGQADYEADVLKRPTYHTGEPRKQWRELDDVERWSWAKARFVPPCADQTSAHHE